MQQTYGEVTVPDQKVCEIPNVRISTSVSTAMDHAAPLKNFRSVISLGGVEKHGGISG
jgi:hypothetical protein